MRGDYSGLSNVITRVLKSERELEEGVTLQRGTERCNIMGFEDGERGP